MPEMPGEKRQMAVDPALYLTPKQTSTQKK
jgi:hypothetical protein